MRQRGAGNREFNNIDFGFAFATPVQVSTRKPRSRTKTPSLTVRTPIGERNSEIRTRSSKERPSRHSGLPVLVGRDPVAVPTSQNQRKRRRLSDISNISRSSQGFLPILEDDGPEGFNGSRSRDTTPVPVTAYDQSADNVLRNVPSSPLFFPNPPSNNIDADKENEPSRIIVKKRKRKSIGQQSLFKKKQRLSATSTVSSRAAPTIGEATEQEPREIGDRAPLPADIEPASPATGKSSDMRQPATQPEETVVPSIPKGLNSKKKRKSITGVKKKRRSNEAIGRTSRIDTPVGEDRQNGDPGSTIRRNSERSLVKHDNKATRKNSTLR